MGLASWEHASQGHVQTVHYRTSLRVQVEAPVCFQEVFGVGVEELLLQQKAAVKGCQDRRKTGGAPLVW